MVFPDTGGKKRWRRPTTPTLEGVLFVMNDPHSDFGSDPTHFTRADACLYSSPLSSFSFPLVHWEEAIVLCPREGGSSSSSF